MAKKRGRRLGLSLARRCMIDFLYFSKKISMNSVSAEKYMDLAPVIEARKQCATRISWYTIFLKAFAEVSAQFPELRQVYLSYPYPHIYEYTRTVGMVAIEREIADETMVMYVKIDSPEKQSLQHLDEMLRDSKKVAPEQSLSFRRFLKFNRLPFLIRRFAWWVGFNFPTFRLHYFGTFGVTGIGKGVRSLSIKSPLGVNFVFDMTQPDHRPLFRMFWDHRIFDGVIVIQIMEELQRILNGSIADELLEGKS